MHDDQIHRLLRTLEDEQTPGPAYADALFQRLHLAAVERRRTRTPFLLLAALLAVLVAGFAVGSGLVRLPEVAEPSASAVPTTSGVAVASPWSSPSSSQSPVSSGTPEPSASPDSPVAAGSVLFAEADGLRIRADPSEAGAVRATIRRGQLMAATGESRLVDDTTWYEVRIGPGELVGWVAGGPEDAWLRLVDDGAVTFACSGCGEGSSIVSVTPFGDSDLRTIAPAGELSEWAWSPDGTRLVGSRGGTTLPYHIVLLGPDGAELADLGIGSAATWSPDGARLAWLGEEGLVTTDEDLVPTTVDLGGLSGGMPLWSPDGRWFAMTATEDPGVIDPPSAVYVVPVAGGAPVHLTEPGYVAGLSWSPDGSALAFAMVDLSGHTPTRAFVVAVQGSEPRALLESESILAAPVWSAAGDLLAVSTRNGLVIADGDGADPRVLVPTTGEQVIGEVSWSPSGRWLLYSMSTGQEPTLYVVPSDGSSPPAAISPAGTGGQQADWQPVLIPLR